MPINQQWFNDERFEFSMGKGVNLPCFLHINHGEKPEERGCHNTDPFLGGNMDIF